ncbi:MAG: entericidin A/B family lipoprotein [Gammaproteobacteria bacterium]|nr:entericidin A/B family lipoprotein [Gammaproteobacteria bacterium]
MSIFTRLLAALFILATPLFSACNTTEGFGEDVEEAGDAIDDEAEEQNEYGRGED